MGGNAAALPPIDAKAAPQRGVPGAATSTREHCAMSGIVRPQWRDFVHENPPTSGLMTVLIEAASAFNYFAVETCGQSRGRERLAVRISDHRPTHSFPGDFSIVNAELERLVNWPLAKNLKRVSLSETVTALRPGKQKTYDQFSWRYDNRQPCASISSAPESFGASVT